MRVTNIHQRILHYPDQEVGNLLQTLASDNDQMLATHKWPPMRLDNGLQVGSRGGHGPIRYWVKAYETGRSVTFQFDMKGFDGTHQFTIQAIEADKTQIKHLIKMKTSGWATLKWVLAIRWLHDAFIEDAFDKVENNLSGSNKRAEWSKWVIFLRKVAAARKK